MIEKLEHELVVSCQALKDEPLYGSDIMAKMALAAQLGGAKGIRAQGVEDIKAIKEIVDLPVIGLIKKSYPNSDVYITPTRTEVGKLLETGCEIIALDATNRDRPNHEKLSDLLEMVQSQGVLAMADCSTIEEARLAESMGFDIISSTMSGYTEYSPQIDGPDLKFIKDMVQEIKVPVFAEGRIHTLEQIENVAKLGVHTIVVGGAITRPQEITNRFYKAMKGCDE